MTTGHGLLAILIRTRRYRDTSLLVEWITREAGLLHTVARGALNPKRPRWPGLDSFHEGYLAIRPARTGQLHQLLHWEPERCYRRAATDYTRQNCAACFYEILRSLVERDTPIPEWFDLFQSALQYLDQHEPTAALLPRFESRARHLAGLPPAAWAEALSPRARQLRQRLHSLIPGSHFDRSTARMNP